MYFFICVTYHEEKDIRLRGKILQGKRLKLHITAKTRKSIFAALGPFSHDRSHISNNSHFSSSSPFNLKRIINYEIITVKTSCMNTPS